MIFRIADLSSCAGISFTDVGFFSVPFARLEARLGRGFDPICREARNT